MVSDNNKRIAKNTFFLYIRMLFTLGVTLYTSRVVLQVLGVEDFGIFNVAGGVVAMFSFLNYSLAGVTQRFLTFEIGKENWLRLLKVFNISVSIHLIIAGIILLLGETIGLWVVCEKLVIPAHRLPAALWVYHLAIFSAIFSIMNVPYVGVIIARERMGIFASISMIDVVFKLVIVYALTLFSFDKLQLYGILIFVSSAIIFLLYRYVSFREFEETHIKKLIWDRVLFREIASFAGWAMNGNLAVVGYTQGLNVLLNLFFGPATNAARAVAVQVQNAVNGFSSGFQTSLNPQITKNYATGELTHMHKLIFTSSKLSFFLLLVISLPLFYETPFVLGLWLGQVPDGSINFIRLTLLVGLFSTLSNPLIVAIHATGNIKRFQLWEGSILLLIVPISYFILKFGYPAESVFVVHLLIALIAQGIRIWIVGHAIAMDRIQYFKKIVLRILVVLPICAVCSLGVHCNLPEGFLRVACVGLTGMLSVVFFLYLFGLDQTEKLVVKSYMKKLTSRKK